jgi:hypothetical protein
MTFNPRDIYYVFDSYVPYKKLKLYPVLMKDYFQFAFFSSVLMIEKTADPDPIKAISMTLLEYIFYKANNENTYIPLLDALLRMVLGKVEEKNFEIKYWADKSDNRPRFKIDNDIYDSSDFDILREIIAEQNGLELPDERIQKTVRDSLEEARRYKEKLLGNKVASLEEQMLALSIYSGWELEKIYNMTIRKFRRAIARANHMVYQQIYQTASMSGFVEFKDKSVLSGWLADIDNNDRYGDVKMSLEELQSKADFSAAKK